MAISGSNYLLVIPNNSNSEEGILISNSFEYLQNPPDKYFVGIYPLNCEMKMEYVTMAFQTEPIDLKYGFHQEILDQTIQNKMGYKISKKGKILDDCYFYFSVFRYDNQSINDNNGIFMGNNESQKFVFDKNYSFLKFSYADVEKEKNVDIVLNLMNNEKYKLKLFINDLELKNEYNIVKNETVIIESKDIKEKCQNEQQICKISFNLISENNLDESLIELKVIAEINDSKNNDNDDNKKGGKISPVVLIIIIVAVIFVVVLLIVIILKLKNKKGDSLNSEIESIDTDKNEKVLNEQDN